MDTKPAGARLRQALPGAALAALLLAACVALTTAIEPQRYHRTGAVAGAEAIGAAECTVCHEEVHRRSPVDSYHGDCESCHGPGSLHADSEEPAEIRFPRPADCLACHELGRSTHLAWSTGEHGRAGLICSDCHNTHNRELRNVRRRRQVVFPHMDERSTLCVSCHRDVAARLSLPSHHPVREGMIGCISCHDPHGDRRVSLGAPTQLCAGCHQDYIGPWIYEHAPVAEDCGYCHNPHGAASFNLLDTSQPAICLSCHTLADEQHFRTSASGVPGLTDISTDFPTDPAETVGPEVAGAFYTRCTDCHGAIHGSYQDPHLRR